MIGTAPRFVQIGDIAGRPRQFDAEEDDTRAAAIERGGGGEGGAAFRLIRLG